MIDYSIMHFAGYSLLSWRERIETPGEVVFDPCIGVTPSLAGGRGLKPGIDDLAAGLIALLPP